MGSGCLGAGQTTVYTPPSESLWISEKPET